MNNHGTTLIELIIIIVVIGILSSVAIPKYQDMQSEAKMKAMKGSLASVREAISMWNAAAVARGEGAVWPSMDSLTTPGAVLQSTMPENPLQAPDKAPDSVVTGVVRGEVVGDRGGAYKPSTCEFWPNTSSTVTSTGCSGPQPVGESNW